MIELCVLWVLVAAGERGERRDSCTVLTLALSSETDSSNVATRSHLTLSTSLPARPSTATWRGAAGPVFLQEENRKILETMAPDILGNILASLAFWGYQGQYVIIKQFRSHVFNNKFPNVLLSNTRSQDSLQIAL